MTKKESILNEIKKSVVFILKYVLIVVFLILVIKIIINATGLATKVEEQQGFDLIPEKTFDYFLKSDAEIQQNKKRAGKINFSVYVIFDNNGLVDEDSIVLYG